MKVNPKNNPVQVTETSSARRTIQVVGLSDSYGAGLNFNGKKPGTFFGDDIRTTKRVATSSSKYSQGLPVFATDYEIIGSAYWEIPTINGTNNGVSEFGTGTDSNGKIFLRSKGLNRYEPGQLCYFVFTEAFNGLEDANGDFIALVGACIGGLAVDAQYGDIKEGYMFGWKRVSGVLSPILRVYKNFNNTEYDLDTDVEDHERLRIIHLELGFLGIHPLLLYVFDTVGLKYDLLKKVEFNTNVTNVNDPNLAIGVYLENLGNTTNITLRNASFQYGNYAERVNLDDASSRDLIDSLTVASIAAGTDTFIAAYRVPQKVNMIKRLDGTGTTNDDFRNTIFNRLKEIQITCDNNRSFFVNFYFIPASDFTGGTWDVLRGNINLLERNTTGTPVLTNADLFQKILVPITGSPDPRDVQNKNFQLGGENVAVITATSQGGTQINDFDLVLETEDLF